MPRTIDNWHHVGRNLTLAASSARRFLELSSGQRSALLRGPESDWLEGYATQELSKALRQARALVSLLEEAEKVLAATAKERSEIH